MEKIVQDAMRDIPRTWALFQKIFKLFLDSERIVSYSDGFFLCKHFIG